MSLMTENKARRLLKEYMDAELKGDDSTAGSLETELKNAGWKISVGAEGYTVIRENGGLFSSEGADSSQTQLSNPSYLPLNNKTTNTGSSNLPLIIGISVGGLILFVAIILGVNAYVKNKNVVS